MRLIKIFSCIIFLHFFQAGLFSQKEVRLFSDDSAFLEVIPPKIYPKTAKSLADLENRLSHMLDYCREIGYITFSVDSVSEDENHYGVWLYAGERYHQESIVVKEEEQQLAREAGTGHYIRDGVLSIKDYPLFARKTLSYFENSGFPFASVFLDSISIEKEQVRANLSIVRGPYITFDTIILKGDAKIAKSYLYPYLGIRRKKPYNEATVALVSSKIAELPFVSEIIPSGIEFVDEKASLYLFLNKLKVNQFDGYIGLVPVSETTGKVALNGELNLQLHNVFTLGESLYLHWKSVKRYSQYMNVAVSFPYLLWTPFGVTGNFVLDKVDTTYLNMNYILGLQYSFKGNNHVRAYYDHTSSSVLAPGMIVIDQSQIRYADYKRNMYGVELIYRKLDYLYNPRRGLSLLLDASAGSMEILKNANVEEDIYEGITLRGMKYRVVGELKGYIPLHRRWVMVLGLSGGTLFGEENVANELFKIGGMRTLQGFDENSLEVSSYLISLYELRFLFAKKSYLNLFFNGAWCEQNIYHEYKKDFPFGFGLGVSFDTKAGIFYLSYALGRQQNNPISMKTGKIHFGIAWNF